jgi:Helicase C-terminal domain/Zinc finger, C3HC4 type (RING finger)
MEDLDVDSKHSAMDIGMILMKVLQVSPKGVLTFFKNPKCLKGIVDIWKQNGTWTRLNEVKLCYVESEDSIELKKTLKTYSDAVDNEGANLLLTMEGRCAESFQFRDNMTRTIMIIGAPYPDIESSEIKAKLKYSLQSFERVHKYTEAEATEAFLNESASSIVNRLISLSIKHAHDYGAVILVGKEFNCSSLLRHLPVWATSKLELTSSPNSFLPLLHNFFKHASKPKVKGLEKISKNFDSERAARASERNQDLIDENQKLRKNIPSGNERKFVALNKQRMQQQEEAMNRARQENARKEEKDLPNLNACQDDDNILEPIDKSESKDKYDFEKSMNKVKLNPKPTQSQQVAPSANEDELTVSYIANTEKLRDSDNCIKWDDIMRECGAGAKIMCNICYETEDRRFLVSKCGHISCEICWQHRLKDLMECPVCKQKVRRKTLIEIVKD